MRPGAGESSASWEEGGVVTYFQTPRSTRGFGRQTQRRKSAENGIVMGSLSALTILYGDLALAVVHAQHRLVLTTLLDNDAHFPLVVVTVNARVLSQGDTCLVRCKTEQGDHRQQLQDQ